MSAWSLIYLGAAFAAYAMAAVSAGMNRGHPRDLLLCAGLLMGGCILGNVLYEMRGPPEAYRANPGIDMACFLIVVWLFARSRAWWKGLLASFYLAQIVIEVWAWGLVAQGKAFPLARYEVWINVLFVGQLLTVALPGGRHVAVRLRDFMSGRRSSRGVFAASRSRDVAP